MFALEFLNTFLIGSRKFSITKFPRVVIQHGYCVLVQSLSVFRLIVIFIFNQLWWWITLIFLILKQLYFLGLTGPTWSLCLFLKIHSWILFAYICSVFFFKFHDCRWPVAFLPYVVGFWYQNYAGLRRRCGVLPTLLTVKEFKTGMISPLSIW